MVAVRQDGGQERGDFGGVGIYDFLFAIYYCVKGVGKFAVEKGRSLGKIGGQLKSEKVKIGDCFYLNL